jgi:hypothetical protein
VGSESRRRLTCVNKTGAATRARLEAAAPSQFTVTPAELDLRPGASVEIEVCFRPIAPDFVTERVVLRLDNGDSHEYTLAARGDTPRLSISNLPAQRHATDEQVPGNPAALPCYQVASAYFFRKKKQKKQKKNKKKTKKTTNKKKNKKTLF